MAVATARVITTNSTVAERRREAAEVKPVIVCTILSQ
jgi:hypothetical protein